jgi:hypothetical protein
MLRYVCWVVMADITQQSVATFLSASLFVLFPTQKIEAEAKHRPLSAKLHGVTSRKTKLKDL